METNNAVGGARAWRIEQTSSIGSFLWLGFWTSLLSLPTLTLFRFWARTLFRQRLWGETRIEGEPLEYLGKGSELFVGFLIATLIVVLPASAAFIAAQFFLPVWATGLVIVALQVGLYLMLCAAIFLARRYQVSRTAWRGVRFTQWGSAGDFAVAMFGYALLTGVTFGWFAPSMRLRLAERLWGSMAFGTQTFSWDEQGGASEPVWTSFALAWFGGLLAYVGVLGSVVFTIYNLGAQPTDITTIALLYLVFLTFGLVFALFAAWHEAVMLRRITKSIRIGGVSLSTRFSTWDFIGLVLTNALLVVFTLGLGYMAAQMRYWRLVARRLEVTGELNLAEIEQAASRGPKSGEGLADAFDLSGAGAF